MCRRFLLHSLATPKPDVRLLPLEARDAIAHVPENQGGGRKISKTCKTVDCDSSTARCASQVADNLGIDATIARLCRSRHCEFDLMGSILAQNQAHTDNYWPDLTTVFVANVDTQSKHNCANLRPSNPWTNPYAICI